MMFNTSNVNGQRVAFKKNVWNRGNCVWNEIRVLDIKSINYGL